MFVTFVTFPRVVDRERYGGYMALLFRYCIHAKVFREFRIDALACLLLVCLRLCFCVC